MHDIGAYGVAQGLWQMGYEAVHFVQGNDASLYCIDRDDGFAAGQTRQAFGQTNHAAWPHSFYALSLYGQQMARNDEIGHGHFRTLCKQFFLGFKTDRVQ